MRPQNYSPRNRSKGPRFRAVILVAIFLAACASIIYILSKISKPGGVFEATPKTTIVNVAYVPVTEFSNSKQNIEKTEVENYKLVKISEITPAQKVLSIDSEYFLDFLDAFPKEIVDGNTEIYHGAVFKPETFSTDSEELTKYQEFTKDNILSFNQTGVTALTRAMLTKLNQVGYGAYFAENIKDFLSATDLTHISNEISFNDSCSNSADMRLCSDWRMYDTITAIGTDIVELTGNHNNDWGTAGNLATIAKYQADGLKTFGGGKDEETAKSPLEISEKGTDLTLIGINYSTSSKANGEGASGDLPGANIYDAADTKARIKEAKAKGNFVIVDIQYSECYCYPDEGAEMPECDLPISGQEEFFQEMIDLGADLVVGTQAHQPQIYELYNGKPIYYGLGNLFFDQTYWPGTERSLVLTHYFKNGELLQTRVTPTVYDKTYQTRLMTTAEAETYLKRLVR